MHIARLVVALVAGLAVATPAGLLAQRGLTMTGAPELVQPTGARAMALGEATVADTSGTESVWWNPALIGWLSKREIGLHFTKEFASEDDAASFAMPLRRIGVVALTVRLFDYGTQEARDTNDVLVGNFAQRVYQIGLSYAGTAGDHWAAGVTYRLYDFTMPCTGGDCSRVPQQSATTSAVDLGAQYRADPSVPVAFGVLLQDIGPALQFRDVPQRDALPLRLTIGASYMPTVSALGPNTTLVVDGAVVAALHDVGMPGFRTGAEVVWQKKLRARAGYVLYGATGSGPSIGFGANTGRLEVELARFFSDQALEAGYTPTYVSLRFLF